MLYRDSEVAVNTNLLARIAVLKGLTKGKLEEVEEKQFMVCGSDRSQCVCVEKIDVKQNERHIRVSSVTCHCSYRSVMSKLSKFSVMTKIKVSLCLCLEPDG